MLIDVQHLTKEYRVHKRQGGLGASLRSVFRRVYETSRAVDDLSFTVPRANERAKLSSLDDVEREQVVRVLAATGNHKGRTADILGVSRPRLRRLMEKYGLE